MIEGKGSICRIQLGETMKKGRWRRKVRCVKKIKGLRGELHGRSLRGSESSLKKSEKQRVAENREEVRGWSFRGRQGRNGEKELPPGRLCFEKEKTEDLEGRRRKE